MLNPPDAHLAVHNDGSGEAPEEVLQADKALVPPGEQAVVLRDKGPQWVAHEELQTPGLRLVVQLQHLPSVAQLEVA